MTKARITMDDLLFSDGEELFSVSSRNGATCLKARKSGGMYEYTMNDGEFGRYKTLERLRTDVKRKIALGYFGKQYKVEGEL